MTHPWPPRPCDAFIFGNSHLHYSSASCHLQTSQFLGLLWLQLGLWAQICSWAIGCRGGGCTADLDAALGPSAASATLPLSDLGKSPSLCAQLRPHRNLLEGPAASALLGTVIPSPWKAASYLSTPYYSSVDIPLS